MTDTSKQVKEALLEAVVELAERRQQGNAASIAGELVRHYFSRTAPQDLAGKDPIDLYAGTIRHLQLAERRSTNETLVQIYNPNSDEDGWSSSHTVIDIVGEDMPFIVDSVLSLFERLGHQVHLLVHPLFDIKRSDTGEIRSIEMPRPSSKNVESTVHVEIDRLTGSATLEDLENQLYSVLADVRSTVEDWRAMRSRALEIANELEEWEAEAVAGTPRFVASIDGQPLEVAELLRWMEAGSFVFVGYREYDFIDDEEHPRVVSRPHTGLGTLRQGKVAARDDAAHRLAEQGKSRPDRWAFIASKQTHSSVASMAAVMDADVIKVDVDDDYRLTGTEVAAALDEHGDRVAAVITTAGTTNLGIIDDLAGIGQVCRDRGVWMHVDGAYGGAALASPRSRPLFDGIECADSFIVDPHKWLFAPFDCCALIYRDPDAARRSHAQEAGYLAFLDAWGDWNPSDFAVHLTRRSRGLPFWFSLAVHGTQAYSNAIDITMDLAVYAAQQVDEAEHLTLTMDPVLSVVVFERIGWDAQQYQDWSEKVMHEGTAFVVPSRHDSEPVYRFCFVNPRTSHADIDTIIERLTYL